MCGYCTPGNALIQLALPQLKHAQWQALLDWREAAEMAACGMVVGSHTDSHEPLAQLSPARQMEELATSKHILEDRLATPVEALASR
jgi:hypothetical protein